MQRSLLHFREPVFRSPEIYPRDVVIITFQTSFREGSRHLLHPDGTTVWRLLGSHKTALVRWSTHRVYLYPLFSSGLPPLIARSPSSLWQMVAAPRVRRPSLSVPSDSGIDQPGDHALPEIIVLIIVQMASLSAHPGRRRSLSSKMMGTFPFPWGHGEFPPQPSGGSLIWGVVRIWP